MLWQAVNVLNTGECQVDAKSLRTYYISVLSFVYLMKMYLSASSRSTT
jgi:hypothetical protein